ncbi:MAG: hypothetical protein ACIAQU_08105 [Phycisphaerales bacterium JB064]
MLALATTAFAQLDAKALVEQLRDDDQDWNASRAMDALGELPTPPIQELHAALDSDDWQQRQIAAVLLWRFLHPYGYIRRGWHEWRLQPQGEITQRLIEVTVEGFRDDRLPYDRRPTRHTEAPNAAEGFRHLRHHAKQAESQLAEGLNSDDYQQRFMCALTLGFGGVSSQAEGVARVLLPHLRDNDMPEDAKWCTAALLRVGPEVAPFLRAAQPEADAQQAELIKLLLLDFEEPIFMGEGADATPVYRCVAGSVLSPALMGRGDISMGWLHSLHDPNQPKPASPSIP